MMMMIYTSLLHRGGDNTNSNALQAAYHNTQAAASTNYTSNVSQHNNMESLSVFIKNKN